MRCRREGDGHRGHRDGGAWSLLHLQWFVCKLFSFPELSEVPVAHAWGEACAQLVQKCLFVSTARLSHHVQDEFRKESPN